jgi:hypothetical protein
MKIPTKCTLLELVQSVNSHTESDTEVVALVSYLINSGRVQLCGNFAGAKISLSEPYLRRSQRRPTVDTPTRAQ